MPRGMEVSFQIQPPRSKAYGQSPLGRFQILLRRRDCIFPLSRLRKQSLNSSCTVRLMLGMNPLSVGVVCRMIAGRLKPAFGRAFEIGIEESRRDSHEGSYLLVSFRVRRIVDEKKAGGSSARWFAASQETAVLNRPLAPACPSLLWPKMNNEEAVEQHHICRESDHFEG